jgi:hypothetical protein
MRVRSFATVLVCAALVATSSRAAELASIEKPAFRALAARTFTLSAPQDVHISGTMFSDRSSWTPARIWVLDGTSRKVVWDAAEAPQSHVRHHLARFEDAVRLPAGDYELYLATFPGGTADWGRHGIDVDQIVGLVREAVDLDGVEQDVAKLEVHVTGEGVAGGDGLAKAIRDRLGRGAAVALVGVGDKADESAGFALREPADVRVICHGEVLGHAAYDGGWIEDADTGKKVWRFDADLSRPAGGARKNRMTDEVVHLAAGRYVAHFATDDEHSYPEFNSPPPDDPAAWGLLVRAARPEDAASIGPFAADEVWQRNALVALTEVRDNEDRSAGFTLRRPLAVRIVALGEGTRRGMVDRGWILDARTRAAVWEMDYDHTEHAGGAEKNREVDEVVHLPAGSYVVRYSTDDSHAYGEWNSAPPFERRRWGITVLAADPAFARDDVSPFDPEKASGEEALARITKVRSDERREAKFTLERDADVEIYALGESDGRDLADYGWIEEAGSGRKVWEMRDEDTEPAGGARKNRMFRGRIHLPAGAYHVVYVTDGSHAWGDWNSAPPRDPDSWGITVTLAERLPAEAAPSR